MRLTLDAQNAEEAAELKKRRQFRKFSYRGIDLDAYVIIPTFESHVDATVRSQIPPRLVFRRDGSGLNILRLT